MSVSGHPPVEGHGVIGDLHAVALAGVDGTIDFLCFPEFDSPSVFASLLDRAKGGRFQIAPVLDDLSTRQMDLPESTVLITRFLSKGGVAEVSDFMPICERGHAHDIVRRAKTVRGQVRFRMVCAVGRELVDASLVCRYRAGHAAVDGIAEDEGTSPCARSGPSRPWGAPATCARRAWRSRRCD